MTRQNINMSQLEAGDVIAVKNSVNGQSSKGWQYALVTNRPFKRAGKTEGVEVFMLKALDPNKFVQTDVTHYVYGSAPEAIAAKELMGLHGDKNWMLHYSIDFIRNDSTFTGLDSDQIRKVGSIANEQAFDRIVFHANTLNLPHLASTVIPDEDKRALGLRENTLLANPEKIMGGEKGKKFYDEVKRQAVGADTKEDMPQEVAPKPKKFKPAKAADAGTSLNITLDNAVKFKLITRNFRNVLSHLKNEDGQPISTLKEAFKIADKQPEKLKDIYKQTDGTTLSQARASGLLEMTNPQYETLTKYFNDRRTGNDPDPTLNDVREMLFSDKDGKGQKILNRFKTNDDKLDVIENIDDAWLLLPEQKAPKKLPNNLEGRIKEAWKAFTNEAFNDSKKYTDEGVVLFLPNTPSGP